MPPEVEHEGAAQPASGGPSLTHQPFGDTELAMPQSDALGDVDFFDLNAGPRSKDENGDGLDQERSLSTPSSMLDTAASLVPSIPFISDRISSTSGHAPFARPKHDKAPALPTQTNHETRLPPNPMAALPGETIRMPSKDHRLSDVASSPSLSPDEPVQNLPKVSPGDGEGPAVIYGKDIVLDAAGYHRKDEAPGPSQHMDQQGTVSSPYELPGVVTDVHNSVFTTFTRDLEAAMPTSHRPPLPLRATDPDLQLPTSNLNESPDLLSRDNQVTFARNERATSEPPPDSPETMSPTIDPSRAALDMDYAWDWGRPRYDRLDASEHITPLRRDTLPPIDFASAETPTAQLKGVEENPHLFVLEIDGRSHTFELGLCAASLASSNKISTEAREAAFLEHRVTFQRFLEEPQVVDDPELVIRYSLQ